MPPEWQLAGSFVLGGQDGELVEAQYDGDGYGGGGGRGYGDGVVGDYYGRYYNGYESRGDAGYGYESAAYGYGEGDRPGHSNGPHRRRRKRSSAKPGGEQPTGGGGSGGSKRHERRRGRRGGGDGGEGGSKPKLSQAELAAFTLETWSGLERPAGAAAIVRRGELPPDVAKRLVDMESETEALRVLLREERRRITREVKSLKGGWEEADGRSREFEQQALKLRCSEATLTRELSHADELTDWWRRQESSSKRMQDKLLSEAKEQGNKSEALRSQLDQCVRAIRITQRLFPLLCSAAASHACRPLTTAHCGHRTLHTRREMTRLTGGALPIS